MYLCLFNFNKMKKQKPITKHLAPQYYELAKGENTI